MARTLQKAIYLAPFGEFADPHCVIEVARAAEEHGWDALLLWDHMWRPPERSTHVADPWITVAGVAAVTQRIRVGIAITPLARRRIQKVARESVTMDHLSKGRFILGVGLGVDTGGELERFGEETDARRRADMLDEGLELLQALWSGETVNHAGAHYVAQGVAFEPRPLQRPRIPVWGAAVGGRGFLRPVRRAARLDGVFPVGASMEELRLMLDEIARCRGSLEGFDVAYAPPESSSDADLVDAGVTVKVTAFAEGSRADDVLGVVSAGPG